MTRNETAHLVIYQVYIERNPLWFTSTVKRQIDTDKHEGWISNQSRSVFLFFLFVYLSVWLVSTFAQFAFIMAAV